MTPKTTLEMYTFTKTDGAFLDVLVRRDAEKGVTIEISEDRWKAYGYSVDLIPHDAVVFAQMLIELAEGTG